TVLLATLGAVGVAALARPAASFLVLGAPGRPSVDELAMALTGFAPGVIGFALVAVAGRVLYAAHQGVVAGSATLAGWLLVALLATGLTAVSATADAVAAVALATSLGLLVSGVGLLLWARRRSGGTGRSGLPRATVASVVAGSVALAAGRVLAEALTWTTKAAALGAAVLVAAVVVAVFVGLVAMIDRDDLVTLARRRRPPPVTD
ncbi:MAG: virulence factor MviN, partial [Actinomycetes bacterium]